MNCKICEREISLTKEMRYDAKVVSDTTNIHDAFDCPYCGCQNLLNVRYPRVNPESTTPEKIDFTKFADISVPSTGHQLQGDITTCATCDDLTSISYLRIVDWSNGSEGDIATMLQTHYAGLIDVSKVWTIGSSRKVTLKEISVIDGLGQPEQEIELVIIGFNHDDLADGNGKAAVTVQVKNTLGTAGYINDDYISPSYSLWKDSKRRTWFNSNFKSALPTWLQNLIKPIAKVTNRHAYIGYESYRGQTNTTDDVFLLSEFETFGSAPYSGTDYGDVGSDGTQYEYMKTQANRVKNGGDNYWWLRSSFVNGIGRSEFVAVDWDGAANYSTSDNIYGLAPAFCI